MTASVSTRGMKGADFLDAEREAMYIATLEYYVGIVKRDAGRKIVFADNSGWNLDRIATRIPIDAKASIEFISLAKDDFDISRGKGFNETVLINKVIEKSSSIRAAGAFLKVTGRYPIFNLPYFLGEAENFISNGGQFYGDVKDHKIYDVLFPSNTAQWNGHAAYTVLFATTIDFWNANLSVLLPEINDYSGDWIECVWYRRLIGYRRNKDCRVSLRFRREPVCGGLQGSYGSSFAFSKDNNSRKAKFMRFVGNCIRICTPWLWF